jgi:hypothetical protein
VDAILNIYQPDPMVGYIYQPNAKAFESGREYYMSYNINSLGLRDREYDVNAKDVFRVLLFGDSFSESHGLTLEESLPKQIEQNLQKEFDRKGLQVKAEVVNISFGGYSPYHYWKSYRRWKSTFNPQLILIGFYMGNDFQCEDENIRYEIDDGEIVGEYLEGDRRASQKKDSMRSIRKWLAQKSELYVLMRNFFYYNEMIGLLTMQAKVQETTKQLQPYLVPEPKEVKKEREKCFGYLKRLKDEAAADGVPVALMTIPVKFEIDQYYLEQIIKTQRINPDALNLDQPYKDLANFCGSVGIYYFDPREAMKKETVVNNDLYFKYDGHWNAKGIETASLSVIRQWEKQKLLPFN